MANILVIDDDPATRSTISLVLSKAGHKVCQAENGKFGMKRFMSGDLDLVITDMVMPDREGIETIIAMRKVDKRTKIIAISGGGQCDPSGYLEAAVALGANTALLKPFQNEHLLDVVGSLLGEEAEG